MNTSHEYVQSLVNDNSSQLEFNEPNYSQVIALMKKNKISLNELSNSENNTVLSHLLDSSEYRQALDSENQHYTNWYDDFVKIKDAWGKENIDYVFHKSSGEFPSMSDNLDVLVRSVNFQKAGETLINLGYVELKNIQEAHKKFFRKFVGDRVITPIHLHERVCWSVPYEDINHIWSHVLVSEDDPLVVHPDYEDIILINTAHCFLEDHLIKLYDILTIEEAIRSKDINWKYIITTAQSLYWAHSLHTAFIIFDHIYYSLFSNNLFPKEIIKQSKEFTKEIGWIDRILNKLTNTKELTMPFVLPHLWIRRHSGKRELDDPTFGSKFNRYYQVYSGFFDRLIHLKLKIHNYPGYFISFSGLDGSGKSSFIKTLSNNMNVCDIKTNILWSRIGSLPLTSFIVKILKAFSSKNAKNDEGHRKSKLLKNIVTNFIWRQLNILEYIIYLFVKITIPRFFSKVVIADRFIIDAITDLEITSGTDNINRFSYKLLRFLSPTPDLAFRIVLKTSIIYQRSKINISEDLEKRHEIFNKISRSFPTVSVDNSPSFNEVSEKISNVALTNFFRLFPDKFKDYKVVSFRYK